jgi:hypothetical protein
MRIFYSIFFLISLIITDHVLASEVTFETLQNKEEVIALLLKEEGIGNIDLKEINWNDIDFECIQDVGSANQTQYNQCRYKYAVAMNNYNNDLLSCTGYKGYISRHGRDALFRRCMRQEGWNNPYKWKAGKKEFKTEVKHVIYNN